MPTIAPKITIIVPPEAEPASEVLGALFQAGGALRGGVRYVYCWIADFQGDAIANGGKRRCDVQDDAWSCEFRDVRPTPTGQDSDQIYVQGWKRPAQAGGTSLDSHPLAII